MKKLNLSQKAKKSLSMKNSSIYATLMLILLCFATNIDAQQKTPNRLFKKNQADVFLTVGLLPTYLANGSSQVLPGINVGGDYMVGDNFSLGASFGHSIAETSEKEFLGGENGQLRNRYYEFTLRTILHITKHDNMSIYGGFLMSYHHSKIEAISGDLAKISYHTGIQENNGKFLPGGFVGFKYAINNNFTLMSELGYGVSILKVGAGYRLK